MYLYHVTPMRFDTTLRQKLVESTYVRFLSMVVMFKSSRINPREEFPESVEYEPKISYWCGPYRYFIPATTDVRCVFSIFSMNFVFRFGYDGVTYKSSDLSFVSRP